MSACHAGYHVESPLPSFSILQGIMQKSVRQLFRITKARLYPNFSDDWFASSSKSERLHKASEKGSWNLNGVAFSRRHRKKGGGPEMLTNESERIGKGRQGFAIPSSLTNRKWLLTQQLMSKNGNARKESQQGGS